MSPEETQGKLLYALGDGQWDIPKLRLLLETIIPEHGAIEDYEVEHDFPHIGTRTMCLNARQVFYKEGAETTILLGIEDVTVRRVLEHEQDNLLRQKDVLMEELQHRISNSLQIIAGIILMKASTVSSEETRTLLQDTHDRVISIATIQQQLNASGMVGPIEMLPYLERTWWCPRGVNDQRCSTDHVKSGRRGRQFKCPSSRECWLDRDGTCHERPQARFPRPTHERSDQRGLRC